MTQATDSVRPATALARRYGRTQRLDRWWLEPVLIAVGLGAFIVYTTFSAMAGEHWAFEAGVHNGEATYLSPFFEPLIRVDALPDWFSPAIWILWAPLAFRTTCYYYRRSYYRSFFLSPPACAVREPASSYTGEKDFPLVFQNIHRYAMYVALLFPPLLAFGAFKSLWLGGEIGGEFGVGVGTIVLALNAFFLTMYTIGCHSFRHLVAGGLNRFSGTPLRRLRFRLWVIFTVANEHHRLWAWTSLIFVGLTDLYVHLVAGGQITDLNTWSAF